jgi:hypothetical protein
MGLWIWVFMRFLLPFSIFSTRIGFGQLNTLGGWVYIVLGYLMVILSLHVGVITTRLIAARPRVFGSWDSLILNEKH